METSTWITVVAAGGSMLSGALGANGPRPRWCLSLIAALMAAGITQPVYALEEGRYRCVTKYMTAITADDEDQTPFVGRVIPGAPYARFFVSIRAYNRLSDEEREIFQAQIEGTGFTIDDATFVATFERDSIFGLNMAFGHEVLGFSRSPPTAHIYRFRFGNLFWLGEDHGFVAFINTPDLNEFMLRGRCEVSEPP